MKTTGMCLALPFLAVALLMPTACLATKSIDLSNKSEPGAPYEIDFCSRPSPVASGQPGHAFVVFSSAGPRGARTFKAIGLQPASLGGALASIVTGSTSGYLGAESYTAVKQNCMSVTVNKGDYDHAWQIAAPSFESLGLKDSAIPRFENYGLGSEDCVTFVIDVAKALEGRGLKVPTRKIAEFPRPYIQRLEAAN